MRNVCRVKIGHAKRNHEKPAFIWFRKGVLGVWASNPRSQAKLREEYLLITLCPERGQRRRMIWPRSPRQQSEAANYPR